MSDRPIHAIPTYDAGEHQANSRCPCVPLLARDLEQPSRVVFIHRTKGGEEQTEKPNWTKH